MLSKTHGTTHDSPVADVVPDTIQTVAGDGSAGSRAATDPDVASETSPAATGSTTTGPATTAAPVETRTQRFRRKAHRGRLHGYAIVGVAVVAYLVALAASNTTHVKVSWVFGSLHVSLVWLVLFTAVLGWLLGILTSARLHWRTRAPRQGGARS
jgi:uncharacterized integral membrane protein